MDISIHLRSLLGPECFYSTLLKGATGKTPSAEHIEELPARRDTDKATRTVSGEIMDQYMEASQSQLGSVHSDSWASPEGGEGRQTGGKAGQRLDDVVMVKVGRRVQSVYDDDNQEDRLTEATAARSISKGS
ncbi:hypothetical protein WJX75_003823 [Coccomyxa subellipsoidea]|uniref:Uncharacterized protein n=1 Tax=Coccomyxa subellipsoidea TaxID=248742 RepID=A0ABR2Z0J2_9CHLO